MSAPACDSDLACGKAALILWCLPAAAVVLGLSWAAARPWLWIPAFSVMGAACLVNAARCGRLHCYLTGPLFLLAALYTGLSALGLVPARPELVVDLVAALTLLARLLEIPLGRYRRQASRPPSA